MLLPDHLRDRLMAQLQVAHMLGLTPCPPIPTVLLDLSAGKHYLDRSWKPPSTFETVGTPGAAHSQQISTPQSSTSQSIPQAQLPQTEHLLRSDQQEPKSSSSGHINGAQSQAEFKHHAHSQKDLHGSTTNGSVVSSTSSNPLHHHHHHHHRLGHVPHQLAAHVIDHRNPFQARHASREEEPANDIRQDTNVLTSVLHTYLASQMSDRLQTLESEQHHHATGLRHPDRDAAVELLQLRLAPLQRKLRSQIVAMRSEDMQLRKHELASWKRQQLDEERRVQMRKRQLIGALKVDLREVQKARAAASVERTRLRTKVCTTIANWHNKKRERSRKDRDDSERNRLRALKENDMDAYVQYVAEAKHKRLSELVQWTQQMTDRIQKQIAEYQEEHVQAQPSMIHGELRPYQLEGVQFLVSLHNNGINGILADEMGLGKTIQAIATIAYLAESKGVVGPHLVVCPLSVLDNWMAELAQWAPSLRCLKYHGSPLERKALRERIVTDAVSYNVIVTTYEMVRHRKEKHKLARIPWEYLIVDEGHQLRNRDAKVTHILATAFKSQRRVLLTGTPLQNSLRELWSLLNFIMPQVFDSSENFEEWFSAPFLPGEGTAALSPEEMLYLVTQLHKVLRPFLLRREHAHLEHCLPPRTETVVHCPLSGWQSSIYEQLSTKMLTQAHFKIPVRNSFAHFRKACSHPYLFLKSDPSALFPSDMLVRASGKFVMLAKMLPRLHALGHKVLLFSQQVRLLDWAADLMDFLGYSNGYVRLDGQTKASDRSQNIALFSKPDSPFWLFLVSTRAGGLGVNLQAADTVIIFDLDWNPQNDVQAIARAYRIGQTRPVRVFLMVSNCPFEDKLYDRWSHKRRTTQTVIDAGQFDLETMRKESEDDQKKLVGELLSSTAAVGKGHAGSDSQEMDVNRLLARSDEEYERYVELDKQGMFPLSWQVLTEQPRLELDVALEIQESEDSDAELVPEEVEEDLDADIEGDLDVGVEAASVIVPRWKLKIEALRSRLGTGSGHLDEHDGDSFVPNFSKHCKTMALCDSDSVWERLAFVYERLKELTVDGESVCHLFLLPPDRSLYGDYYSRFPHVVCLLDIAQKIERRAYSTPDPVSDMAKDVATMTGNSMNYNEEQSFAWRCARHIQDTFDKLRSFLFVSSNEALNEEVPAEPEVEQTEEELDEEREAARKTRKRQLTKRRRVK